MSVLHRAALLSALNSSIEILGRDFGMTLPFWDRDVLIDRLSNARPEAVGALHQANALLEVEHGLSFSIEIFDDGEAPSDELTDVSELTVSYQGASLLRVLEQKDGHRRIHKMDLDPLDPAQACAFSGALSRHAAAMKSLAACAQTAHDRAQANRVLETAWADFDLRGTQTAAAAVA